MLDKLFDLVIEQFGDKVAFAGLAFTHDTGYITVDIHEDGGFYVSAFNNDGEFVEDYIAFDKEELADVIAQYID